MVAAIVLGAGGSRRLGRPKQLESLGDRSLIRNAVDAALEGGCSPVVVVVGADAERVSSEIDDPRVITEHNPRWRAGLASSIRQGIAALQRAGNDVEAAVLMACDQPHLSPSVVRRLIDAYRSRPDRTATMAASAYAGILGTPALFARERFERLLGLEGDHGAQTLLLESPDRVVHVAWPEGEVDIDRPEDASRQDRER